MTNATIETYSGKEFDILDPQPDQIDIESIAHAESMVCRFAGHDKPGKGFVGGQHDQGDTQIQIRVLRTPLQVPLDTALNRVHDGEVPRPTIVASAVDNNAARDDLQILEPERSQSDDR